MPAHKAETCSGATAYTNLQVDIDRIRADNLLKKDVQRKSGLIIWAGRTLLASRPRL